MKTQKKVLIVAVAMTIVAGCHAYPLSPDEPQQQVFLLKAAHNYNQYCKIHDKSQSNINQCCKEFYKACNIPALGVTDECKQWLALRVTSPQDNEWHPLTGCSLTLYQGYSYIIGPMNLGYGLAPNSSTPAGQNTSPSPTSSSPTSSGPGPLYLPGTGVGGAPRH